MSENGNGPTTLPDWWWTFIRNVCELPGRSSPADEPTALIASAEELQEAALDAIADHSLTAVEGKEETEAVRNKALNEGMDIALNEYRRWRDHEGEWQGLHADYLEGVQCGAMGASANILSAIAKKWADEQTLLEDGN